MRSFRQAMLEAGELWTYSHSQAGLSSGQSIALGFITGPERVIALDRAYESTGISMRVHLYKIAFTGGSAINQVYNRNLAYKNAQQPIAILAGVTFTPNAPEITAEVRSLNTSNKAYLHVDDENTVELLENTSYVLQLVSTDTGSNTLSTTFTMRRRQQSEILR